MTVLPKTILLHIGAHKTASTHFQFTLHRNRHALAKLGVSYYGPAFLRRENQSLPAMFGLSWSKAAGPTLGVTEQLAQLAQGRPRLILSEENFVGNLWSGPGRVKAPLYPNAESRIEELIKTLPCRRFYLSLAIRNPATYMMSCYSQALMRGQYIDPDIFFAQNPWQAIDWADYIARLRAIPGLFRLQVWRFEDYPNHQRRLFRQVVHPCLAKDMTLSASPAHVGLSERAVLQTFVWALQGREGSLAQDARQAFPKGADYPAFMPYDAETLVQAQAAYDAQLARIAAMQGVHFLSGTAASETPNKG